MGLVLQPRQPEADRTAPCPKESPFGMLLSSLHSAKDILIPVVAFTSVGRSMREMESNIRMVDHPQSTVNAREEDAVSNVGHKSTGFCPSQKLLPTSDHTSGSQLSKVYNTVKDWSTELLNTDVQQKQFAGLCSQGSLDDCRTALHKDNQPGQLACQCRGFRKELNNGPSTNLPQYQVLTAFFEGLSNSCLNPLPKQGNTSSHSLNECGSGNKDGKDFPSLMGLQKHLSGLSLQGLSSIVPSCNLISKPDCVSGKDLGPMCLGNLEESYEIQKPLIASFFQIIMEHCLLASSNISKHAGQLVPWNENFTCITDNPNKEMITSQDQNVLISVTVQDFQLSSSSHRQDLGKERKQTRCLTSAGLGFARVGGELKAVVAAPSIEGSASQHQSSDSCERDENSKTAAGLFKMPLPNIERLRSTLPTVSLTELMELVPQIGKTSQDFPDKKKLFSVQDFFRYTEAEGRRFFEELDRDNDGQVTLEDLEVAMRKRRLPHRYAREFLRRTRKHWFAKSFGWNEFLSLMEQKEPMMLRAYNSLSLSKSGTLQKGQMLASLRNAGLPATEENATAMMRCLDADTKGSIAYGQFRNFMLLLPPERLGDDPRMVWFEAATVVPMAPPVALPAESVLKSALAGGLACALSTSLMHPIDTMKTRVQASSTLSFPELISKLPEIGVRGLYRGSVPAILGQFSSHGLRTGIFEASKLLLTNVAPDVPEFQVQSLASFCSTVLGTAVRIPCEVLKQRLQAGIFDNVGDAIIGTWQQDGPRGFFRGTGATLCREVPFYVAGMGIYAETKKVMQQVLNRELAPWETIAVGAISGGLAAVCTTPFDVMKTRTMTAAPGLSTSMSTIAISIVREEGLLGLFKGAVPRFFWIAPLGAMNFAGYELAKRAMENKEEQVADIQERKPTNA